MTMHGYPPPVVRHSDVSFASETPSCAYFREVDARLLGESVLASEQVFVQQLYRRSESSGVRWRFRQGQHALLYFKEAINAYDGLLDGRQSRRSLEFKDRLFFIPANSEIDGFVKITGDYSYFVTLIDDGIIDQEPTIVDTLRSSSLQFGFNDPVIVESVGKLESELLHPDESSRLIIEGWAIQLLGLLYRRIIKRQSDGSEEKFGLNQKVLSLVIEGLREGIAEDTPLAQLAAMAGLSNRQFLRRFHNSTGTTPGRMQLDLRMERAANLLVESSFSITEISAQCGFSQPQHLATAFRKRYSLTPTEFRRHRLR
ncbi:helix-turn-helix domain-containing protein [Pseudomonas aeruginosa]|uniref:helix-turn-helix domain-containing protein n=1 Tax=Pseudomonas sp. FFUP_PS_41 TaxID=2060417 RepID=UPI00044B5D8D|nr:helix-turn-helix domain-containing protein [Pseudomonas sp. FFUP_PS_41]ASP09029.1 AraC family transcriptional regulator [Pseudomonas aeruginosa]AVC42370.1 AraC family transcriptional regulator [Achromobacter xylosoxidans]KAJ16543.1 hypothetical protein M002_30985 [Pseudomonas aeruginosa ID4365]CVG91804.1 L-rhamnose operon regulatory protein rhaS [Serratia marcescens]ASP10557.1 AraC family transcriptional regulator [Pseudomonas aeruginosa]